MKKILAFTAIRSEYDLLSNLYKLLNSDKDIELKLIVSGAHLSKSFGYSVQDIEKDDLSVLAKIETLLDSDSKSSRVKSGSILLQNAIDIVANYKPDLIIYGGDREEVIIASIIGGYLEIPTIHFFGGDHVKDSHIDNPIRHATSKLSTVHFVSNYNHYNRLYKMGEDPKRIFNIGSVAIDKFINEPTIDLNSVFEYFDIDYNIEKFAILIFHPIPKERLIVGQVFENILLSLINNNIKTFVSYPNIDPGNKDILEIIDKYKNHNNFIFYKNLSRSIFINLYRKASFIIGNSSSGIVESASIPIPAINVGYRQTGREPNANVIFSDTSINKIDSAIKKSLSVDFCDKIKSIKNIYGDGDSSKKAFDVIKNTDFSNMVFKNEDILDVL